MPQRVPSEAVDPAEPLDIVALVDGVPWPHAATRQTTRSRRIAHLRATNRYPPLLRQGRSTRGIAQSTHSSLRLNQPNSPPGLAASLPGSSYAGLLAVG